MTRFTLIATLVVSALLVPLHTPVTAAGPIYNWSTESSLGTKYWSALAASADGSTMLAGGFGSSSDPQSYLYLSNDHGNTWTQTANNEHGSWAAAAISDDGSTLVAAEYSASDYGPGNVYISHDHGTTWSMVTVLSPGYYSAVATSADGSVISATTMRTASDSNGSIYTSADSGATWTTAPHTAQWYGISISSDGSTIIAAPKYDPSYNPDYLYLSHDSGATWSPITTVGSRADAYWSSVAVSSDSQTIVAVQNREGTYASGNVYMSHDRGASWAKTDAPTGLYSATSISGNGQVVLVAQENDASGSNPGVAELSTDSGTTWSQVPITPNQNFLKAVVSRDGSTLGLTTENDRGASGTYGSIYFGTLIPPPRKPVIDPIHTGDTVLRGTTSPHATVTAHFVTHSLNASSTANTTGRFVITVPPSITLKKSDVITFEATSPDGVTSTVTRATVTQTPKATDLNSSTLVNTGDNRQAIAVISGIAVLAGSSILIYHRRRLRSA